METEKLRLALVNLADQADSIGQHLVYNAPTRDFAAAIKDAREVLATPDPAVNLGTLVTDDMAEKCIEIVTEWHAWTPRDAVKQMLQEVYDICLFNQPQSGNAGGAETPAEQAPAPSTDVPGLDERTMQKLREALRFSASRSVMSSDDERRNLDTVTQSREVAKALSAVIEGWDFWEVAPHDREPPRDAIRKARAALAATEGSADAGS